MVLSRAVLGYFRSPSEAVWDFFLWVRRGVCQVCESWREPSGARARGVLSAFRVSSKSFYLGLVVAALNYTGTLVTIFLYIDYLPYRKIQIPCFVSS